MRRSRLRDADLWRVFHCLFRSCVALAYPERWDQGLDPTFQPVFTQEEFIPTLNTRPLRTDRGFVDFDMNDRNVMIGDYDRDWVAEGEHAHDQVPVFKVGDFGNMRAYRAQMYRNSILAIVNGRVCGNRWCNAPEQFTQSWKNIATLEDLQADETAGKYDWWTNLWQVARLMDIMVRTVLLSVYCALLKRKLQITQLVPDIPPTCVRATIAKPTGVVEEVFTYGSHLLGPGRYDHYDPALRATVAWCMAHRPGDRPTMVELEGVIQAAIARGSPTDNDEDRSSVRWLLTNPPPPPQSSDTDSTLVASEESGTELWE